MENINETDVNTQTELNEDGEVKEYVIFHDKTKSGRDIELAVVDEFEFERKYYVVGALIEGDTVNDENLFIYRLLLKGKVDYSVEKITDPKEYEKIAKAYIQMEEADNK